MRFVTDYAKVGTASCKFCKEKTAKGSLRVGKISAHEQFGDMTQWLHPKCLFDQMLKSKRATRLESLDDLEGLDELKDEDRKLIENLFNEFSNAAASTDGNDAIVNFC